MKSFARVFQNVRNSLVSRRFAARRPKHRGSQFFSRPMVENLEHRRLLATLYVDNLADYTVTTNNAGGPGADNGDVVTWNPGAGSQHGGPQAGLVFGTDAFASIGSAVTAATAGDTIRVAPGTFTESVNVNKQLFVLGNQNGVDAQTRVGAPESIVDGGGGTPFNVGVSDVVIDGFTIQGATGGSTGFGVTLVGGTSGSEIRNNIIQNNIAGLSLANNSATNQTIITGNLITNNNQPGPVSGTGIYADQFTAGGPLVNVLIDNNTFSANNNVAVLIGPTTATAQASNITISCNTMTANGNAILLFNTINSTITQNEIFNSAGSQVVLGGGNNGLTITQNFIEDGATRGIRIGDFGGGSPNQNFTINRNSIEGNAGAGLEIAAGQYIGAAGSLNAEFNWWGSATGPTIASNPGGTGEEIVDPAGQVDYTPFLPNGVDIQPALCGFQPSIADLSITKDDAPDPAIPGSTVTYTIVVSNNGPDTQTGATVADTFSAQFTSVTFTSVGTAGVTGNTLTGSGDINDTVTIPSAGTITYTVTGTIASGATGTISNTATVTAPVNTFETDLTNNSSAETTALTPQADLSVSKTDSPDPVIAGNNLTYTILVTNIGSSDAQGVSLSDLVPVNTTFVSFAAPAGWSTLTPPVGGTGTVTATIPTLVGGASATFTLVVNVNASTLDGAVVSNTATVTSNTTDTNSDNNLDTETTDVDAQADLSVTKSDSPDPVIAGTNLTYTINVSNTGVSDAQTVALSDLVPAGTTFVSFVAPAGWAIAAPPVGGTGTVTATRPTLAAGAAGTFTLVVNVNANVLAGATLTNTASVTSTTVDPDLTDNADTETTTVGAQADLSVTKTDSPDPVTAGSNLTYTIVVTNTGSSDAQTVSLSDLVPANTTFVSFTAPAGWATTTPAIGGAGTVTATRPTLAAGGTGTFTLVVKANASLASGSTITNTATVSSATTDPTPGNNSDTETTAVNTAADLSVTKTDSPDPVTAGSNLTYTILVTNTGSSDAQGVSLTDLVPANTTFVSFAAPGGWSTTTPAPGGTGTVTANNATLAAGATATFTLIVQVSATTLSGATITNTAAVTSTTSDPVPGNNSDTETTTVNASADLSVTKSGTPSVVVAGQNLTYTIVVTNNGVSDAQGVNLSDLIPTNTTFVSLSSPAGWSSITPAVGGTGTVTSTRATLAAGSGPQTFTLIVKADDTAPNGATITNTAAVAATTTDPDANNNSASSSSTVNATADVTVDKTANSDSVSPGQQLTYTIIVSNNGVVAAQNVSLSDLIPADTTFVSFAAPAGWTTTTPAVGDTGVVTSENPSLAPGDSATFTLIVRVDPTAVDGTVITNTADVTTTTVETDDTNNASTATTDVTKAVLQECDVFTLNEPGALNSATLGDDADNPGAGVLIVTGTNKSDVILIEQRPADSSQIRVKINGQFKGIYNKSDVQRIVAFGLAGNDTIIVGWVLEQDAVLFGNAGNDYLFGGAGQDQLDGGSGNDHLFGGLDDDALCGDDGNDFLYGQQDNDFLSGDAGNDRLFGEGGDDHLQGGIGNDHLYGGIGNDRLFGQAGNDFLFGENGNDIAVGGDGNDKLWGGIGRDLLVGGDGNDTMYGEGHDDIVVANSTVWDNDELALMAILSEWTSSNSYTTRVNNIRSGGGQNGAFTLDSGTVLDDGRPDTLWGHGGQDWFLTGVKDKIRDKAANELVN